MAEKLLAIAAAAPKAGDFVCPLRRDGLVSMQRACESITEDEMYALSHRRGHVVPFGLQHEIGQRTKMRSSRGGSEGPVSRHKEIEGHFLTY